MYTIISKTFVVIKADNIQLSRWSLWLTEFPLLSNIGLSDSGVAWWQLYSNKWKHEVMFIPFSGGLAQFMYFLKIALESQLVQ